MDGSFPDEVRDSGNDPSGSSTAVVDQPKGKSPEELAEEAAVQSPAEPQTVPEGRPHSATVPAASQRSDTDVRRQAEEGSPLGMGQEAYDLAASEEQMRKAEGEEHQVTLLEGARVQIISGPDEGRMAVVMSHVFDDPVQKQLFYSAAPGKASARVAEYELKTRDGRADVVMVTPDQVKPLDTNNGWGRGTI